MTCAWTETSSAETGSSQTIELGLQRERAGDADALALAAGELVRIAVAHARAQARPCSSSSAVRSRRAPAVPSAVEPERLADDVADRHARVERGERVLEDDLHVAPQAAQLAPRQAR